MLRKIGYAFKKMIYYILVNAGFILSYEERLKRADFFVSEASGYLIPYGNWTLSRLAIQDATKELRRARRWAFPRP
ncbi:MAG: hypothetical protein WCT08_04100 [Patescibacteria group bacterium]